MSRTTTTNQSENNHCKKWTPYEESRVLHYVKARPQNLHHCFMMVAEEIGRTESAVASHWYSVLSKKPDTTCFFTASPKHVSRNRKNGEGVESNNSVWRRLMEVIRNII